MKISNTPMAIVFGIALTLGACSGSEDGDGAEDGEETAAASDAVEHPAEGYMVDESGRLEDEMGPGGFQPLNDRLSAHHTETGEDIRILVVTSTNGQDIGEMAQAAMNEAGADAMIYVAARDQDIAVGGAGVTPEEGSSIAQGIVNQFNENEDFNKGFNDGIDALTEAMNN